MNRRSSTRTFHLAVALVIGTYIYSPWGAIPAFAATVKFGVFPSLAVSGLWLWFGSRMQRRVTRS